MGEENSAPGLWDWTPQPLVRGAGRPEHVPTQDSTRRVVSLLALGASAKEVAMAIGISVPTLRKQYFSDPRIRAARLILKGELLAALVKAAVDGGNVAANEALWKRIEKAAMRELPASMKPAKAKPEKLGKKQQRRIDAAEAREQSTWGDLVEGAGARPN